MINLVFTKFIIIQTCLLAIYFHPSGFLLTPSTLIWVTSWWGWGRRCSRDSGHWGISTSTGTTQRTSWQVPSHTFHTYLGNFLMGLRPEMFQELWALRDLYLHRNHAENILAGSFTHISHLSWVTSWWGWGRRCSRDSGHWGDLYLHRNHIETILLGFSYHSLSLILVNYLTGLRSDMYQGLRALTDLYLYKFSVHMFRFLYIY